MTLKELLIENAKVCAKRENISLARLATKVVNDGKFFTRLANGGEVTTATLERFEAYFDESAARDSAA